MPRTLVARMATTRPVEVSDILVQVSPEALKDAADSLNTRAAIRMSVEHDPYAVSVFKTGTAWIEPLDEYESLVVELLEAQTHGIVTSDTEREYVLLEFPSYTLPFARRPETDRFSVSVDLANFDSLRDLERFESAISGSGMQTQKQGRRSLTPEPVITIVIPGLAGLIGLTLGYYLLKPFYEGYRNAVSKLTEQFIIDNAERFLGIKINSANRNSQSALTSYKDHQSSDERPVLVERILKGKDLDIVLLERVGAGEDLNGIQLDEIMNELADQGRVILDAREITLVRNPDGELRFWYLHTENGDVIATEDALDYTDCAFRRLGESRRKLRDAE